MKRQTLDDIHAWFKLYIRDYTEPDGKHHPMLKLKIAHSVRVAAECRSIARRLGWGADDVRLAEAIGILHDIGRFPQYLKYRTLVDPKSVDHGDLGCEMFVGAVIYRVLEPYQRDKIEHAIRYHNKRDVPRKLRPEQRRFVKLARDADKLDILLVIGETIRTGRYRENPDILLHMDPDGPVNPALVREIRRHRRGSYEYVKSLADWTLLMLAWVYNINYLPALRSIVSRGLLRNMADLLPDSADARAVKGEIMAYVREKTRAGEMELL